MIDKFLVLSSPLPKQHVSKKLFTFDHTLPTAISIFFFPPMLFFVPFSGLLNETHRALPLACLSSSLSFNTLIRLSLIEMCVPLSGDLHRPPSAAPPSPRTLCCLHAAVQALCRAMEREARRWVGVEGTPLNPAPPINAPWCALQMSTFVLNKKSYCFCEKTSATACFGRHEKECPPPLVCV